MNKIRRAAKVKKDPNEQRVIPTAQVWRAANTTTQKGERVLEQLEREGKVAPERTPAGRTYLSPREFQTLWSALWDR